MPLDASPGTQHALLYTTPSHPSKPVRSCLPLPPPPVPSAMASMMAAISLPLVCGCSAGAHTARVRLSLSAGHSTQLLAMNSVHLPGAAVPGAIRLAA